jgi:uroporphyrinogen-III synthase
MIEQAGAVPVCFPVIAIEPVQPKPAAPKADIMIFVSANAVRHGAYCVEGHSGRVAAIGEATARELQRLGIAVDIMPEQGHDSEALLATDALQQVAGKTIAIIRGQGGREYLARILEQRGARVEYLECYRRIVLDADATSVKEQLCSGAIDLVTVTSVEILDALMANLGDDGCRCLRHCKLMVVSERAAAYAQQQGIEDILLSAPGDNNMLNTIIEWRQRETGAR